MFAEMMDSLPRSTKRGGWGWGFLHCRGDGRVGEEENIGRRKLRRAIFWAKYLGVASGSEERGAWPIGVEAGGEGWVGGSSAGLFGAGGGGGMGGGVGLLQSGVGKGAGQRGGADGRDGEGDFFPLIFFYAPPKGARILDG